MPVRPLLVGSTLLIGLLGALVPRANMEAQRRPGVGMGFYTTTGLLSADVEVGSVNATTSLAEVPTVAASLLVTAPLARQRKSAWIAGARVTPIGLGNGDSCYVTPGVIGCQDLRFTERGALLTGGAFDVRSTVLRVMAGTTLYSVQNSGTRLGTTLRVDYGAPRLRGATPTLFLSRTFMGSQRGETLGITTFGAALRWVRKK